MTNTQQAEELLKRAIQNQLIECRRRRELVHDNAWNVE